MLTIVTFHIHYPMILTKNISEMERIKDSLKLQFKKKDMEQLHYYVGVYIVQDEKTLGKKKQNQCSHQLI